MWCGALQLKLIILMNERLTAGRCVETYVVQESSSGWWNCPGCKSKRVPLAVLEREFATTTWALEQSPLGCSWGRLCHAPMQSK